MAYHAGAELANLECFQINPLIKDYNGPACAYVTGPFGGYTANTRGERFIECDYWSGQMMLEFYNELQSGKGPVFLKLDHLAARDDRRDRDHPAHQRAPQARPLPRAPRHELPAPHDRDAHLRDRLLQRPQRLGRLGQRACRDDGPRPLRRRRHGQRAAQLHARRVRQRRLRRRRPRPTTAPRPTARARSRRRRGRAGARARAARRADGIPPHQFEYKLRRMVNDYLQPPKVTAQDQHRAGAVRRGARGPGPARGPRSARADARAGDPIDPRLRRHGGGGLALPHREPLGPLSPTRRLSRDRQRQLVLPLHALPGRRGGMAHRSARSHPISCRSRRTR